MQNSISTTNDLTLAKGLSASTLLIRSLFVFCGLTVSITTLGQNINFTKLADLPPVLKESSGLEFTTDGHVWTVVDSNKPILFGIDEKGQFTHSVHLNNVNHGWEDVTQDDQGNFYIGDFGNNQNTRKSCRIYKLPPPDSIKEKIITAEFIDYTYPDQKEFPPPLSRRMFDMDAMASFGEYLYLFSKNRTQPFTGYTRMYRVPNKPGTYVAELMDSVNLGPGHMYLTWVTAADFSPDKKTLALLTHDKVWLFHCFTGNQFLKGTKTTIPLNHFSQKEGLVFRTNNELYISDERTENILGGCLYRLTFDPSLLKSCP